MAPFLAGGASPRRPPHGSLPRCAAGERIKKMKAAAATDITVDLEGLDCTRCLYPFQPPVFQCAAGHVICSTCHEKLLENNYCQLCYISTAGERI